MTELACHNPLPRSSSTVLRNRLGFSKDLACTVTHSVSKLAQSRTAQSRPLLVHLPWSFWLCGLWSAVRLKSAEVLVSTVSLPRCCIAGIQTSLTDLFKHQAWSQFATSLCLMGCTSLMLQSGCKGMNQAMHVSYPHASASSAKPGSGKGELTF